MMKETAVEHKITRYKSYKDSGVEWLGEIPEHWEVKPGFTILSESKKKNIGFIEDTVLSLSYGNVIVKPKEKLTGLVPESFETYQLVEPGDIIIRPTDLQNDKTSLRTGLAKNDGIITSAYINLRVNKKNNNSFYHYYLHTIDINKVIYGLGSGLRQNISFEDFKRFPFPFPPLQEQTKIAQFLDDKTTKIDAAIGIKEQQIQLLQERKQILIHKAVTRGLDDSVMLKDSGVEWIGEIPEGWEVKRLGIISEVIDPQPDHRAPKMDENGLPYLGIRDINEDGTINTHTARMVEIKAVEKQERSFKLNDGDILYGKVGTLGNPKRVLLGGERVALSATLVIVKTKNEIMSKYLKFALDSDLLYAQIQRIITGATRPALGIQQIRKFKLVIPNSNELLNVVEYLESSSQKIETAITLKQQEIEKLKEYKSSLINSCVTGKVRVC